MSSTIKPMDGQRKSTTTSMDASQRKSTGPVAWTKGSTNPVTLRPSGTTANGVTSNFSNKSSSSQKVSTSSPKETNTPDKHANDRMLYLLGNFMGSAATITLRNGERFTGIFSTFVVESSDCRYLLKMVRPLGNADKQVNGVAETAVEYVGSGPEHLKSFSVRDVVDLNVAEVRLDHGSKSTNGASGGFKTDTDISSGFSARERELKRWEPAADSAVDMTLGSTGQGWDQFEANERLYGVKTGFDESQYTTTIDKSHPDYKRREAKATRLAREIEGSSAMNSHVAEERGNILPEEHGADEEAKYSGVRREPHPLASGKPDKYMPPARRAPTGQPTVSGAPVDPAIISSSLARPGSGQKGQVGAQKPDVSKDDKTALPSVTLPPKPQPAEVKKEIPASVKVDKPAKPTHSKGGPGNTSRGTTKEGGATATVEKDVHEAFKQFSATEKMRLQEHQRKIARQDKAVKLNDLKKFAENFKLHTPVPKDLVPILAKDKGKQEEIVKKADKNVQELKSTPQKAQPPVPAAIDPKTSKPSQTRNESSHASPMGPSERQPPRNRQNQNNFSQSMRNDRQMQGQPIPSMPPRQTPGHLTQRMNMNQPHRNQNMAMGMHGPHNMQDPRHPPTGPAAGPGGIHSPTGSARFNAKAMEFRPNPNANTFLPSSNASSGSSPVREPSQRPDRPTPRQGNFFEGRRAIVAASERPSLKNGFNPIKRMKKEIEAERKDTPAFPYNGGIPNAYRTPPTWESLVPEENREKKYREMFEKAVPTAPSVSPHPAMNHPPMPHQHQLPHHLQQPPAMPQGPTPQHTPRHMPAQPHMPSDGPPTFGPHPMQFSASTSSMQPSPRGMQPFIAYPQNQNFQVYQQTLPGYGGNPGGHPMTVRQVSGGPHYMPQGPGGMGQPMMANQQGGSPYMNVPMNQVPMFGSPVPAQAYPHHGGQAIPGPGPQQPGSGFPSPRPQPPLMMHQGSQQGHHGHPQHQPQHVMYMTGPGMHPSAQAGYAQVPTGPMPMRGTAGPPGYAPNSHHHTPAGQPPHYGSSPHAHHQQPHHPSGQPHFPQHGPPPPHRGTPSASYVQPMMGVAGMPPQGMPGAAGVVHAGPVIQGPIVGMEGGEEGK